jgi:ABC-type Fe3+/spermidine/putrescine transport system ATPase subunit
MILRCGWSRLIAVQTPPLSERALPLLAITGLRRSFGEVDVLSGVDAEVGPGEAVAVVGPNGSGKSTLLRCVAGMDRPSAGSIRLCGRPMRERDPQTRRSVAAVLDDVEFFADLAVVEHLALLMSAHGDAAPDEHAVGLLGTALERRARVIPVLVDGATMPARRQLPDDLAPLARLNALPISYDRYEYDEGRLITAIQKLLAAEAPTQRNDPD